jgi:hypothetical protein
MQLVEKSVLNMIRLLLPVSDWSNMMIGPGGLLLGSSSHVFAFQVSKLFIFMGGVPKK